jgi:fibronectin-binding autotransporter adhesin
MRSVARVAGLLLVALVLVPLPATAEIWTAGGSGFWSDPANWDTWNPPNWPGAEAIFPPSGMPSTVTNDMGTVLLGTLTFESPPSYTLVGSQFTMTSPDPSGSSIKVFGGDHYVLSPVAFVSRLQITFPSGPGGSLSLFGLTGGTLSRLEVSGGTVNLRGNTLADDSILAWQPGTDLFIYGTTTCNGSTWSDAGARLTVMNLGVMNTMKWYNGATGVVQAGGTATVYQDLDVGGSGTLEAGGNVTVGGTTSVESGGQLTVLSGGLLRTGAWANTGTAAVQSGGRAEIINDLTVGAPPIVDSFFDVFGEVSVGGTTYAKSGAQLTVQPGGLLVTTRWVNPGSATFVQPGGTANITQDLLIPTGGAFDAEGDVTVGGTTSVDGFLQVTGAVGTDRLAGGGFVSVNVGQTVGSLRLTLKAPSWTTNPAARQNVGMLRLLGGLVDLKNNLINVNYGTSASPYAALAANVNSGAIYQSTGAPDRTVGIYDTALNLDGATPGGRTVRVGYAAPGDTMLRGHVDSSDIINLLAAGKYGVGPSNARWDEGDFTHDSQVNSSDLIAVLAAGVFDCGPYDSGGHGMVILGPPSATRATLIYDAMSGDVKIDPNGNTMTGLRLKDSAANFFVGTASFPPGGAFTTDSAAEKFWSSFNPPNYLVATWDLGNICPAGLTEAQFAAALNNASGDSVWTKAGGGSFDYNVSYLPEPASLALLALGGLALIRRRTP